MFSTVGQFQESRPSGIQGYVRDDASIHPKKIRAQSEVHISTQDVFKGHATTSQVSFNREKWETTKVTTNGHTVCFTYFARTHQVVARILQQNQRSTEISSIYLPTELKRIRSAEQFNFLIEHCYLRTATLSNGEVVLHLNGRLAGGSGYPAAVGQLAINEMLDEIRVALLSKENKSLLDLLIDELFDQQLTNVDLEILRAYQPKLADRVMEVSQKYMTDLKAQQPPEVILKRLVEEANYARLVEKEQCVVVARMMELFRQSHEEIKTIMGKTIIAFFGDTGSGKSTAVNYFKGVKLEYITNRIGDRIIQVKNEGAEQKGAAKIGQVVGQSETLHTKGYPLRVRDENNNNDQGEEIVLADFPGFESTRGKVDELCAKLSTDLAILKAHQIKSVVITIPIHAFLMNRAYYVIKMVEKVRERFPFAFNPDRPRDSESIFVLITKTMQVRPEIANGIKDRMDELFRESQRQIATLMGEIQEGKEVNDFELRSIQRCSRIWQALQQMYNQKQIDLIEIEDSVERDVLLNKYKSAPGIDKREYVQEMQSAELKMKFGKYVEMFTDTWKQYIFKQYLHELPDFIKNTEKKRSETKKKVENLEEEKKRRLLDIVNFRQAETNYLALVAELESAQHNSQNQLSEEFRAKLESMVAQSRNIIILRLEGDLRQKNEQIITVKGEIKLLEDRIDALVERKTKEIGKKTTLEAKLVHLSEGSSPVMLWMASWEPDDPIKLRKSSGTESTITARDYRGVLLHQVPIERNYNLMPTDPELRKKFRDDLLRTNSATVGNYQAKVTGIRFNIDSEIKASPDGRKVVYVFKTEWKGDVIPKIEIIHTIPNIDYNEAMIIDKNAEIAALVRQISELEAELAEKQDEKNRAGISLRALETEKSQVERYIEAQEKAVTQEKIDEMLQLQKEVLKRTNAKITELEDFTGIENEMTLLEQEQKVLQGKLLDLQKAKRNLAIVIHQQKGTAKVIRDFSQIVVDQANTSSNERAELVNACRVFMDSYDQNIGKAEAECKKDLPFTN